MGENTQEVADHGPCSHPTCRKLLSYSFIALFTLSLIYLIFCSSSSSSVSYADLFEERNQIHQTTISKSSSLPPPQAAWLQCNYSDGQWVWDAAVAGPRYDSEHCDMKSTEKCAVNGKPDKGYLHWRWQPAGCNLTALDPAGFLRLVRGKRLAFVGDSTARNQAEALVCLLSTAARPEAAHRYEERLGRKFWRWTFPAPHAVAVSTYWSPYLVRAEGHSEDYAMAQQAVVLDDLATEPWAAADAGAAAAADVVVVSAGHWFPRPAMYYEGGEVVGVHARPDLNWTDVGYLGAYRKALRRALEHIAAAPAAPGGPDKVVAVATVAPSHFDPAHGWDHRDACSRTRPYADGEAEVAAADAEMRKVVLEEVTAAVARRGPRLGRLRFEVLDVTRMATMRPDGHPGPYLFPHSYEWRPVPETVANDCLHWCAPGPVDTFNDVLARIVAGGGTRS